MNEIDFEKCEIKEVDGQLQVVLYLASIEENYRTEFGSEFGFFNNGKQENIKDSAIKFFKKKFPKIKQATILVVAGAVILTSFPLNKAEAHTDTFNMSYLFFGNTTSYLSQIEKTEGNLNLVSPSYFDINQDGSLHISNQFDPYFVQEVKKKGIKVVPFLSNHWDRKVGRAALENRELLTQQIADFIIQNDLDGVQVDIENVTNNDRENFTDLVRLLRERLPADKEVSVAVAANPYDYQKGWHGSYDYTELAKYTDYLMIMSYDESYPGSKEGPVASYRWVEKSIQYAINKGVPPEKIVLGIPFYGRYWKEGKSKGGGRGISNKRVDEMLERYGGTIVYDEKLKSPKAVITIQKGDPTTSIAGQTLEPGTYHIWFENEESIKAKLSLVHKYGLKGTGSWSLGQENANIWKNYSSWRVHDDQLITSLSENNSPSTSEATHTVEPGDTLWKIAKDNNLTVEELKRLNDLSSDVVFSGQILKLSQQAIVNEQIVVNATKTIKPKISPSLVGKSMVAKANNTIVRNSASSKGKVVKKISTRDTVKVLSEYKDKSNASWIKIKSGTVTGWVPATQLATPVVKKASAPSTVRSYPTLKYGSKGSEVMNMQNNLKKAGHYKGKSHGNFDSATKSAVVNFQKKYKLKPDGIAGKTTLTKLGSVTKQK